MRNTLFFSIIFTLPLLASIGHSQEFEEMRRWEGKSCFEAAGIHGEDFYGQQRIRQRLRQLLPERYIDKLSEELTTVVPAEITDGYLHFSQCRRHACANDYAVFFLRLADGETGVLFHDGLAEDDAQTENICFSSKLSLRQLPEKIRATMVESSPAWWQSKKT